MIKVYYNCYLNTRYDLSKSESQQEEFRYRYKFIVAFKIENCLVKYNIETNDISTQLSDQRLKKLLKNECQELQNKRVKLCVCNKGFSPAMMVLLN